MDERYLQGDDNNIIGTTFDIKIYLRISMVAEKEVTPCVS